MNPCAFALSQINVKTLLRALPLFSLFCLIGWSYVTVRSDFAWEDADPEILNQAWRAANGEAIYRAIDEPPYIHSAYPPLYFEMTAFFLKLFGLSYLPSRLISFLSALAIGAAFVLLSKEWKGRAREGLWAACFLFLIPSFLYNVTRTHPQMLAVALTAWSFILFTRKTFIYSMILSPILAILAIYTKHTTVALPIAVGLYLLIHNRKRLVVYSITILTAGLLPLYYLEKTTNGNFLRNIVTLNSLHYYPGDIAPVFIHHAGPIFLFIGFAAMLCYGRFKERKWETVDYYLIVLTTITLFTCGRTGAHTQYVIEFCTVVLIYLLRVVGLPFSSPFSTKVISEGGGNGSGRMRLLQYQMIFLMVYTPLYVFVEEGRFGMAANNAAGQVYKILETKKGNVISQQGSFPIFKGDGIYVQLGHFSALAREGLWDQSKLQRDIEIGKIIWLVTQFPIEGQIIHPDDIERFNPPILDAIRRNFKRVSVVLPYYVYTFDENTPKTLTHMHKDNLREDNE